MAVAAKTAAIPPILLILSMAFTIATIAAAHHSPSSSDKTRLVKACSEALGPGGGSLVTFCARDFLGDKAGLLAVCGKQEAATIVVNEARKKANIVEGFKSKIDSDKSLGKKELMDLKSCWESMNAVIKTVGKVYVNVAIKKLSVDVMEENIGKKIAGAMGQCKFSSAERQTGLWAEFHAKADESFKAQVVALAFMGKYHSI